MSGSNQAQSSSNAGGYQISHQPGEGVEVTCKKCGRAYRVKTNLVTKKLRCKNEECRAVITVPKPDDFDDFRLVVGRNSDYYLEKWAGRLQGRTRRAGFNWVAFLFTVPWLAYRKMYRNMFILMGVFIVHAIVAELTPLPMLSFLVIAAVCGDAANGWYLSHCARIISQVTATGVEGDEYANRLARRGGTNIPAMILVSLPLPVGLVVDFLEFQRQHQEFERLANQLAMMEPHSTGINQRGDEHSLTVESNPAKSEGPRAPIEMEFDSSLLPSGYKLLFHVKRDDESLLCSITRGSAKHETLAQLRGDFSGLEFSSDGGMVLFKSKRTGATEVYSMSSDGTNIKQLTSHPGTDESAVWSPDAKKIAWHSKRTGVLQIWVMDANGGEKTQLTSGAYHYSPFWSPDGSKIGFTSYRDGDFEIYLANADGSNPVRITRSRGRDFGDAWSSNGTILFRTNRDYGGGNRGGHPEIYSVNQDGTQTRRLTINPNYDGGYVWTPDGETIAFLSKRDDDNTADIYLMNRDGSKQRRLSTCTATVAALGWVRLSE